jgi:hypothetical protein
MCHGAVAALVMVCGLPITCVTGAVVVFLFCAFLEGDN